MEAYLFVLDLLLPVALGGLASLYLKGVTRRLLVDVCGTEVRAAFWERVTVLLMVGLPLVLCMGFGQGMGDIYSPAALRHSLLLSVLGVVLAVLGMARVIMRTVPVQLGDHL